MTQPTSKTVSQFALVAVVHRLLHILDDAEENAQTGEVTIEVSKWDWKSLNDVIDKLGDSPHDLMHDLMQELRSAPNPAHETRTDAGLEPRAVNAPMGTTREPAAEPSGSPGESCSPSIRAFRKAIEEAVNPHAFNCGWVKHPDFVKMVPADGCTCGLDRLMRITADDSSKNG